MSSKFTVRDVVEAIHRLAPAGLALAWDNVGLQLGEPDWTVSRVLITLDVTAGAVEHAAALGADLIVTHHPLIFKPLPRLTDPRLLRLAERRIAVLCAHTNLDAAPDGVNAALARRLDLADCSFLSDETGSEWFHVSVYVPAQAADTLREAVHQAGAGLMGGYDRCSVRHEVTGAYRPLPGSRPAVGQAGEQVTRKEMELEFMVDGVHLPAVLDAVKAAHPYETPAYWIHAVRNRSPNFGLGLVGRLPSPQPLTEFARTVKARLNAPTVRLWPANRKSDSPVHTVAVAGGSGKSLVSKAAGRADVLVTGDMDYHSLLDSPLPVIDAGHFPTEYPVLEDLQQYVRDMGLPVEILNHEQHEIHRLRWI
jgi:dinuclear metal center YbgI/SA1388 family protein